ncbi:MAG: hypothetical protein K2G04_02430, partial [Oscillospiraceae bacterium]|nr:hypothetical protein [Oscillospiraceae bacterium]
MDKKLFAAVLGTVLLCSCGDGGTAEVSETTAESVTVTSVASETTVTTTAVETVSGSVSEVSETEEKAPITRDFFNDDAVFEEVMLPVKVTYYKDGAVDNVIKYEYDAAGNKSKYQAYTYEYDYNQDGTYNSITTFFMGETEHISRFDENGYCIEITSAGTTTNYKYEFDETERLIRKTDIYGDKKENFEYTYDEAGRLYEEFNNVAYYDYSRFRHEYVKNIENIYYFRDGFEEVLWKILEKDENGNIIKETIDVDFFNNDIYEKIFTEYK